jgi:hypothetical protein
MASKADPYTILRAINRNAGNRDARLHQGGTGETWAWPQILRMWWSFKNPVSRRTPENSLPDCVPCEYAPDLSMTRHGYLLPPTGPESTPAQ